jgi:hypothetical protein
MYCSNVFKNSLVCKIASLLLSFFPPTLPTRNPAVRGLGLSCGFVEVCGVEFVVSLILRN